MVRGGCIFSFARVQTDFCVFLDTKMLFFFLLTVYFGSRSHCCTKPAGRDNIFRLKKINNGTTGLLYTCMRKQLTPSTPTSIRRTNSSGFRKNRLESVEGEDGWTPSGLEDDLTPHSAPASFSFYRKKVSPLVFFPLTDCLILFVTAKSLRSTVPDIHAHKHAHVHACTYIHT